MTRSLLLAAAVLTCLTAPLRAQCPDGTPPPCGPRPRLAVAPAPGANSLAVLYFENRSRDTADAYLADGITDAIGTRLGQVARLTVKSQAAVRRFRGAAAEDPAVVARALGVTNLVSGSVQRVGRRLRITVELVRATTGDRQWGEQYDRSDADLLAVQEEIAGAVATAIAGRLLPQERAALAAQPTRNAEAYDHYLRGNYQLAQRTPRGAARAIEEYGAAVRLDPRFVAARARIGFAYSIAVSWGWEIPGVPAESLIAYGGAAAEAAVRLDSTSAEAWLALAGIDQERDARTYRSTLAAAERAVALDPRNAEAHHIYGVALSRTGRDSEAVREELRAIALEPERVISLAWLGYNATRQRRYDESRRWLDSAIAIDPAAYYVLATRGQLRAFLGDTAGGRADAETALRLSPPGFPFWAASAEITVAARSGDTTAARRMLATMREALGGEAGYSLNAYFLARALIDVGDYAGALDAAEQVRVRGVETWWNLGQPWWDPLRADPRYQRLLEAVRPPGAR
jgi:TolB-like protein/Tfp pilus assembly protein PilF